MPPRKYSRQRCRRLPSRKSEKIWENILKRIELEKEAKKIATRRGLNGLEGSPKDHLRGVLRLAYHFLGESKFVKSCEGALRLNRIASRAAYEVQYLAPEELYLPGSLEETPLVDAVRRMRTNARLALETYCREPDCSELRKGLSGLSAPELMLTRGYKDGNKSWVDVQPVGGRKMRVTHELFGAFDGLASFPWAAAGIITAAVLALGSSSDSSTPEPMPTGLTAAQRAALLESLNKSRVAQGLEPLT